MKYTELGQTGMKISHLAFGASSLGSVFRATKENESIEAVEAAIEGGINFIDVSPYYGHYKAETVLGMALKRIPRDKYFLSTKVGRYGANGVNTWDYSAKRAVESVYESMERLNVEHIDLINVHDIEFANLEQVAKEILAYRCPRCGAAVLHRETVRQDTGCEALYAVDGDAQTLKALCMALEEEDELVSVFKTKYEEMLNQAVSHKNSRDYAAAKMYYENAAQAEGASESDKQAALQSAQQMDKLAKFKAETDATADKLYELSANNRVVNKEAFIKAGELIDKIS